MPLEDRRVVRGGGGEAPGVAIMFMFCSFTWVLITQFVKIPPATRLHLCFFLRVHRISQSRFTMGIKSLTLQRRKVQPR